MEELRATQKRLQHVLASSPAVIYTVDPVSNFATTYVSDNIKTQLGYEPEEVIGKRPCDLMPQDEAEWVGTLFRDTVISQKPLEMLEHVTRHRDGRQVILETSGIPIFDEQKHVLGYRGIARDVTERKQVEHELLESRLRYRTLFENAPVGIGLATAEGQVLDCNAAMLQITGYSKGEIRKINVRDTYENPEQRTLLLKRLQKGEVIQDFEVKLKRKDGTVYHASLTINRITLGGEDVLLTIEKDITERKKAEEEFMNYQNQLRSLASKLSSAEEQERRRIATYLHDNIGHSLAMCKINLGLLRESLSIAQRDGYLDKVYRLIEQTIQLTRSLTSELSPPVLYELGLSAAIESLVEDVSEQYGIRVNVKSTKANQIKKCNSDLQILLFHATRELLANIIKHAQAQNVKISIRRYNNKIRIDVKDDGVGFDTSQVFSANTTKGGFGLFNIRERFDHFGGHLNIQSQPGCGTCVTIVVPLETTE